MKNHCLLVFAGVFERQNPDRNPSVGMLFGSFIFFGGVTCFFFVWMFVENVEHVGAKWSWVITYGDPILRVEHPFATDFDVHQKNPGC